MHNMDRAFIASVILLTAGLFAFAQDINNPQTNASALTTGTLPAGRLPALTGDVTSSAGSAATTLAAGSASNLNSGTLPAARLPTFGSGDVSFASGGGAGTIANSAVTNAKLANASTTVDGTTCTLGSTCTTSGPVTSKLINSSRDLTTASGSQAVTGFVFTPSACIAHGAVTSSISQYIIYNGLSDSSGTSAVMYIGGGGTSEGGATVPNNFFFVQDTTGANSQGATISSYASNTVNLTWTKTGTPTGTFNFALLCFK